jgi:hypothetical protein
VVPAFRYLHLQDRNTFTQSSLLEQVHHLGLSYGRFPLAFVAPSFFLHFEFLFTIATTPETFPSPCMYITCYFPNLAHYKSVKLRQYVLPKRLCPSALTLGATYQNAILFYLQQTLRFLNVIKVASFKCCPNICTATAVSTAGQATAHCGSSIRAVHEHSVFCHSCVSAQSPSML